MSTKLPQSEQEKFLQTETQKLILNFEQSKQLDSPPKAHNDVAKTESLHLSSHVNQDTYLTLINEIFELFEASMRVTPTSPEFVCCLIDLHQNNINGVTDLVDRCNVLDAQYGPTLEQLLQHIKTLQTSFVKFALSYKPFQYLLESDQNELLKRNGLMFVMVCFKTISISQLFCVKLHHDFFSK